MIFRYFCKNDGDYEGEKIHEVRFGDVGDQHLRAGDKRVGVVRGYSAAVAGPRITCRGRGVGLRIDPRQAGCKQIIGYI